MSSSEWNEVKLGDLCNFQKGYAFKSKDYQLHGRRIIKVTNLNNYNVNLSECVCIDECKADDYQQYQLHEDDVIITTVGSWPTNPNSVVGRVIKVQLEAEKSLLNQNAVRVRGGGRIDQRFLFFALKSRGFFDYIVGTAQGAANQASITQNDIKFFRLSLPPMMEQKAIANTLSCLDDKIELNKRINKTLEEMAQAIFTSWFVDFEPFKDDEFKDSELGRIPKGWRVGILGDVLTLNYGKSLPAKDRIAGPVKVFSSAGITGYHNQPLVNEACMIVGRKGTIGTVYYSTEPSFCIDTAYYAIQKDSKFPLLLMYQLLKEINLTQYNEDSAVPGLNRNTVYSIKIVIPPDEVLRKYTEILTSIYKLIFDNINQTQALTEIPDSLLPKLMSGEIRVPLEEVQ